MGSTHASNATCVATCIVPFSAHLHLALHMMPADHCPIRIHATEFNHIPWAVGHSACHRRNPQQINCHTCQEGGWMAGHRRRGRAARAWGTLASLPGITRCRHQCRSRHWKDLQRHSGAEARRCRRRDSTQPRRQLPRRKRCGSRRGGRLRRGGRAAAGRRRVGGGHPSCRVPEGCERLQGALDVLRCDVRQRGVEVLAHEAEEVWHEGVHRGSVHVAGEARGDALRVAPGRSAARTHVLEVQQTQASRGRQQHSAGHAAANAGCLHSRNWQHHLSTCTSHLLLFPGPPETLYQLFATVHKAVLGRQARS